MKSSPQKILILFIFFLLLFLLPVPAPTQFVKFNGNLVDEAVKEAMDAWKVPGVAVGIVQGDRILYLKGYGVREIGKKGEVTPDTLFALGSCSKPFTTLLMALLADAGLLDWDDLVRNHLPYFHLADPLADANVTLRDLVTHRTGLASHDLLWYRASWSVEDSVRKLAKLKASKSFRSAFKYQSIMFSAAGLASGKAGGSSWENLVRKRIFEPLDMNHTNLTTANALKVHDRASPHHKTSADKIDPLPWYDFREPNPAGSINSTARDLCCFLQFHLSSGLCKGKRLVSKQNLLETRSPQIVVPIKGAIRIMNPHTMQISYGMGWVIQDYRGQLVHLHGGAIDGFRAQMTMLPTHKVGIVVLSNLQGTGLNTALTNSLIDQLLRYPYQDWNAHFLKLTREEEATTREEKQAKEASRHKNTKPSRELSAYCGLYEDSAYGKAKVTLQNGNLHWEWSSFRGKLIHYHFDTFSLDAKHLDTMVVFSLGMDGDVDRFEAMGREFKKK